MYFPINKKMHVNLHGIINTAYMSMTFGNRIHEYTYSHKQLELNGNRSHRITRRERASHLRVISVDSGQWVIISFEGANRDTEWQSSLYL